MIALLLPWGGCIPIDPGESPPNLTGRASFAFDIQPIFDKRCVVCHRPKGVADDIFDIEMFLTSGTSYDHLVDQPSEKFPAWKLVAPGDPQASLLYRKVADVTPPVGFRMPIGQPPLSDDEIALIEEWIEAGAPRN